jgi:hypothetical protein
LSMSRFPQRGGVGCTVAAPSSSLPTEEAAFLCCLQKIFGWAMLGSNQRPLPCESEACSFATVRRHPIPAFLSQLSRYVYRGRSPTFAPVVVKLSSEHRLPKLSIPSYLYPPECVEGRSSELRAEGVLGGPGVSGPRSRASLGRAGHTPLGPPRCPTFRSSLAGCPRGSSRPCAAPSQTPRCSRSGWP